MGINEDHKVKSYTDGQQRRTITTGRLPMTGFVEAAHKPRDVMPHLKAEGKDLDEVAADALTARIWGFILERKIPPEEYDKLVNIQKAVTMSIL